MDSMLGDLRYGARMLWKSKGLTLIALLSLAFGIGANVAVFSLVNSILLSPRPVAKPAEVVEIYRGHTEQPYQTISYPSYAELRARNGVLTDLAAYGPGWQFRLGGGDEVEQVWGETVTGNYFSVLGVVPAVGRGFLPEEDSVPSRNPVVVIGHSLWQRKFGGDPGIVGRTIRVNDVPLTVVGVAPASYTGMLAGWAAELWVPLMITPALDPRVGERRLSHRGNAWLTMVGRLRPGVSLEDARARFARLSSEMQAAYPEEWTELREEEGATRTEFMTVLPESDTRVHPQMRAPAWGIAALLFVIVNLVLVVACLNLAGMLFARAIARRGEIAVRLSLGAGRRRIVQQLLTESLLLALVAGAAGTILAIWTLTALSAAMPALPEGIRLALTVRVDWRVLAYSVGFATLAGVLFGLSPALHAARAPLSGLLREEGASARASTSRAQSLLVIGQVAFSLVLLVGAGLLVRSMANIRPTALGFASEQVVVAPISLPDSRYDRATSHEYYRAIAREVGALPGVQAVTLVEGVPGGFMSRTRRGIHLDGRALEVDAIMVGPGYFTNMRVPITAGRDFDARDREGAPCTAVVNEVFARQHLRVDAREAIGRSFQRGHDPKTRVTCAVVGVVRDDAWQTLNREPRPFMMLPVLQHEQLRMTMLVHARGAAGPLVASVRGAMRRVEPLMPTTDVRTLTGHFDMMAMPFRALSRAMVACGVMALLLAVVGIYGIMAYSVARRRREMGIRIALGALRADILRMMVGQGMRLVAIGVAIGIALGMGLTRVLASLPIGTELLFGVSAFDPLTFALLAAAMGAAGMAACLIPAHRASTVDPMRTLRDL